MFLLFFAQLGTMAEFRHFIRAWNLNLPDLPQRTRKLNSVINNCFLQAYLSRQIGMITRLTWRQRSHLVARCYLQLPSKTTSMLLTLWGSWDALGGNMFGTCLGTFWGYLRMCCYAFVRLYLEEHELQRNILKHKQLRSQLKETEHDIHFFLSGLQNNQQTSLFVHLDSGF